MYKFINNSQYPQTGFFARTATPALRVSTYSGNSDYHKDIGHDHQVTVPQRIRFQSSEII